MKRSRFQSGLVPRRRIWAVMEPPENSFHSQTFSRNFARPRSWRLTLCVELSLHHDLGGDAGVVGAGLPQGVVTAHAMKAGERIHDGLVETMTHVQRAGDVGGGSRMQKASDLLLSRPASK